MKVSLFIPCIVDIFAPQVGISTYNILKKFGCEVNYPFEQTCCGQPAFNTGFHQEAKKCAERFLKIFHGSKYIVAPSGSCVAMVKNFYDKLDLTKEFTEIYHIIRESIYELSDFLVNVLNLNEFKAKFNAKVTYHDSCHLLRELKIKNEPRMIIQSIRDIEYIELPESDKCCGFGGTFSVKFPELSVAIAEEKVNNIERTGVDFIVASDVSCLLNINGILKNRNSKIKPLHIAELIDLSLKF